MVGGWWLVVAGWLLVVGGCWLFVFCFLLFVVLLPFFPNSFSYGVFANIGSGAVPGRPAGQVPGGSGKVPGQVPNHGFREGSGAGSEPRVPGRFWGRL